MVALTHVDTHVLVWLYAGLLERFPETIRARLASDELVASPVACLELQYLFEIGRITEPARAVVAELERTVALRTSSQPLAAVVAQSLALSWTRDPFDRLIVGDALAAGAVLVTKNERIRAHVPSAVWG